MPVRKLRALGRRSAVRWWSTVPPRLRGVGDPFASAAQPRLVVHCSHHRGGTVWLSNVLHAVARHFGMPFCPEVTSAQDRGVAFSETGEIDRAALAPFRGSHMIRDPRDMVVSGYHYHLWTRELWAHRPDERFGGQSYQERLRALGFEDGLRQEILNFVPVARAMLAWDYDDARILELRYEDVLRDEASWFRRLFLHYGFEAHAAERATAIALRFSFNVVAGRPLGMVRAGQHLRSGMPGQWLEVLPLEHSVLLDEVTNDAAVRLGYPPDPRRTVGPAPGGAPRLG